MVLSYRASRHIPRKAAYQVTLKMPSLKVLFLTNTPTYHQVDLFDRLAKEEWLELEVLYSRRHSPGRRWKKLPSPMHRHRFLPVIAEESTFYINPTFLLEFRPRRWDLVVVTQYASASHLSALVLGRLAGVPLAFWSEAFGVRHFEVQHPLPNTMVAALRGLGGRIAMKLPGHIWGIGISAVEQFSRLSSRPVINVPYFSNLMRFRRRSEPIAPGGIVRYLFLGRYSYRKGYDTVIGAFRRLAAAGGGGKWTLTFCGYGADGVHPEEDLDDRRVRDIGFVELGQVPDVLRAHDVLVAPSRYDGWGMVVPEALAAGLAVVSTSEMGSARDMGGTDGCLRIVPAGNEDRLFQVLLKIQESATELASLSRKAVVLAQKYDVSSAPAVFRHAIRIAREQV